MNSNMAFITLTPPGNEPKKGGRLSFRTTDTLFEEFLRLVERRQRKKVIIGAVGRAK